MTNWAPDSWRTKKAEQQVEYPDPARLAEVLGQISHLPPLVTAWEVDELRSKLARAARGEAFLLQGGDCSESFDDCRAEPIESKLKILLQMSLVLVHATRTPVVRVGRIAGQYAKPRSAALESRGGETLPSYRGDIVNRHGFSSAERTPDPQLLLRGYERAALTLNFVRALTEGGFADLHHPENWDLEFAQSSRLHREYEQIVENIKESIAFLTAVTGVDAAALKRVELYTSHEALALDYEMSPTRRVGNQWYNLSTHLPWIGMRTAQLDGAHVEFCRGLGNPIGIKIGQAMTPEWLSELVRVLNPQNQPGRLVLIHRFGASTIGEHLPKLIETVQAHGFDVLFCVDPMHGNTETTEAGVKTRRFENILSEVEQAFEIHRRAGSRLGGVHFELTGEDVTECVGGARGLSEADLERAYLSRVDPRLNYEQALEMALAIARHLKRSG
jgi:3-deoxy-7-phosphoheptulonate synthase